MYETFDMADEEPRSVVKGEPVEIASPYPAAGCAQESFVRRRGRIMGLWLRSAPFIPTFIAVMVICR